MSQTSAFAPAIDAYNYSFLFACVQERGGSMDGAWDQAMNLNLHTQYEPSEPLLGTLNWFTRIWFSENNNPYRALVPMCPLQVPCLLVSKRRKEKKKKNYVGSEALPTSIKEKESPRA